MITGFTATVDPAAAGRRLVALIDVRLAAAGTNEAFEAEVAELEAVTDALHVTGRFDYQLRVACRDTAELDRLLRRLKRGGGGDGDRDARGSPQCGRAGRLVGWKRPCPWPRSATRSPPSSMPSATSRATSRHVDWLSLLIALALFIGYLSLRALASFRILRAAYPDEEFPFKHIWGAYLAGYGFNAVVPARGGDIVRLFLTKTSVPQLELSRRRLLVHSSSRSSTSRWPCRS